MDKILSGKRAIVTGGTRGIGHAITEALLAAGASVAICGRNEAALRQAVSQWNTNHPGRIHGSPCNVANPREVSDFFAFADSALGDLDILVNNAGVGTFKSTADLTLEDWHRVLDTNLSGVFYCCHNALPRMRNKSNGYIINISSLAGKNPFAGAAAYNASKFGLNGFSEAMMLDHRNDGIRVSYVMPGSVNTDFGSGSKSASWKIAPSDVADIVMFLLRTPERTLISRVEVRPSKPGK